MEIFFGAGILVGVASLDVILDEGSPSQIISGVDHSENVSSNTCRSFVSDSCSPFVPVSNCSMAWSILAALHRCGTCPDG